eukprot:TRINITY_DN26940_c0_g1_i1.p1 TRINITY_DN26940_c0_g1~~TRINITY_DN26940_c0_g1_i1.p1  ORF type:complete len:722 (+),score=100.54 TRINITY_DN26940_c0_g1_i1:123-2288(+)
MLQPGVLCIPYGLQSLQGQTFNGRLGEVRDVFPESNRAAVCFDPRDPRDAWKKMPLAKLLPVDLIPDFSKTLDPRAGCPALSLQASEWTVKVSSFMKIHEKVFLSCTSLFMHGAMASSILDEISICKGQRQEGQAQSPISKFSGGDDSDSDSDYDSDSGVDVNRDAKLLYAIARLVLQPQYTKLVLNFEARPPVVSVQDMYRNKDIERRWPEIQKRNEEIIRDYEKCWSKSLKVHHITPKEWRVEAINGESCENKAAESKAAAINAAKERGLPFSVTFARVKCMDQLFREGRASQGGPILVTAMHVAARLGDTSLCHVLSRAGAEINPNIHIPSDQGESRRPNCADGTDYSQYRWGLITPMRLAHTFGAVSATAWFRNNGGDAGGVQHTQLPGMGDVEPFPGSGIRMPMVGSTFARLGAPGFSHLAENSCWTSTEENMIYYLNTYMHGARLYPDVLYESDYVGSGFPASSLAEDDSLVSNSLERTEQDCVHEEPTVVPDPTDAVIEDIIWSQRVEERITEARASSLDSADPTDSQAESIWMEHGSDMSCADDIWNSSAHTDFQDALERIFVVKFSRSIKDLFPSKLHKGEELETVRAMAEEKGQKCRLKSGASIFVYPNQYNAILSVLSSYTLQAHHVVVAEAFLPLIYNEIKQIPSKSNVKPIDWKLFALIDDENPEELCCVERTFYNCPQRRLCTSDSVTQSTSEVHHCLNIRRPVIES